MLFKGKIAFHTLGCKLNYAETSSISRTLESEGYQKVDFEDPADVYVINTCSVTENADRECRQIIRKSLKRSPEARVVVIGCYAQLKPNEIATIKGVDLVLGTKEKFHIAEYLRKLPVRKSPDGRATVYSCDINDVRYFESGSSFGERTRAFLKVQDGCNYSCTYCTIPLARGKSRSDSISHVVAEANRLAAMGVKEIVLTGVNIGDFGIADAASGQHTESFLQLIQQLDEITEIERFRISSIEPNLLNDRIIEFVASAKRFMPHFHIPLQSGSDRILGMMKRRYTVKKYTDRIEKIKSLIPYCCIGADVIVGFPGETDHDFNETYTLLQEIAVSYLHVFTYSERNSTEAALMQNVVPLNLRQERNKMLRMLSDKKKDAFYNSHVSEIRKVLFESSNHDGNAEGYTDNYIRVRVPFSPNLQGAVAEAELVNADGDRMYGRLRGTIANELSIDSILTTVC